MFIIIIILNKYILHSFITKINLQYNEGDEYTQKIMDWVICIQTYLWSDKLTNFDIIFLTSSRLWLSERERELPQAVG